MTDLHDLPSVLAWLAKTAPERCEYLRGNRGEWQLTFADGGHYVFEAGEEGVFVTAAAEYLVRELIEEAGWNWSLSRQGQKCTAVLVKTLLHGPRSWVELKAEAPTPLLALTNALRRAT